MSTADPSSTDSGEVASRKRRDSRATAIESLRAAIHARSARTVVAPPANVSDTPPAPPLPLVRQKSEFSTATLREIPPFNLNKRRPLSMSAHTTERKLLDAVPIFERASRNPFFDGKSREMEKWDGTVFNPWVHGRVKHPKQVRLKWRFDGGSSLELTPVPEKPSRWTSRAATPNPSNGHADCSPLPAAASLLTHKTGPPSTPVRSPVNARQKLSHSPEPKVKVGPDQITYPRLSYPLEELPTGFLEYGERQRVMAVDVMSDFNPVKHREAKHKEPEELKKVGLGWPYSGNPKQCHGDLYADTEMSIDQPPTVQARQPIPLPAKPPPPSTPISGTPRHNASRHASPHRVSPWEPPFPPTAAGTPLMGSPWQPFMIPEMAPVRPVPMPIPSSFPPPMLPQQYPHPIPSHLNSPMQIPPHRPRQPLSPPAPIPTGSYPLMQSASMQSTPPGPPLAPRLTRTNTTGSSFLRYGHQNSPGPQGPSSPQEGPPHRPRASIISSVAEPMSATNTPRGKRVYNMSIQKKRMAPMSMGPGVGMGFGQGGPMEPPRRQYYRVSGRAPDFWGGNPPKPAPAPSVPPSSPGTDKSDPSADHKTAAGNDADFNPLEHGQSEWAWLRGLEWGYGGQLVQLGLDVELMRVRMEEARTEAAGSWRDYDGSV
ncbi:hypothetical protein IAT38_001615 [Cryptococcus sp. DSM 104549]